MKNIHIIPTDKPSRLFKVSGELKLTRNFDFYNGSEYQNIYITSDEEIKEGDWCYDKVLNLIFQTDNHTDFNYVNQTDNVFKIILATEQGLDGVQAIDDTFLEWFVNNSTCEEVEVEIETTSIQLPQQQLSENSYDLAFRWINKKVYKIIIPQEEPKPAMLEEAAEKFANDCTLVSDAAAYEAFIAGAKRQQERSYSEEEVLQLLLRLQQTESYDNLYSWFEQFKKK